MRQYSRFLFYLYGFLLVSCTYLREATKSAEEGSLRHWRHLVIINRHLYAMCGLHLLDFPFLGDGTIADAIGFYLSVEKSFAHAGCELSCNEAWLRCIAGKRLVACIF